MTPPTKGARPEQAELTRGNDLSKTEASRKVIADLVDSTLR